MAADPVLLTLLVGLGLREFSMAPTAIPLAKRVIRGLRAARRARAAAARCARTAAEIEKPVERPAGADEAEGGALARCSQASGVARWEGRPASIVEEENSGDRDDASREAVGLRAALGEDRSLRRQADSRQRRARAQPAVPQPEGRDDLPLVRTLLFEIRRGDDARQARDEGRRGGAHHAEDRPPHDRRSTTATSSRSRRRSCTTSSASRIATGVRPGKAEPNCESIWCAALRRAGTQLLRSCDAGSID